MSCQIVGWLCVGLLMNISWPTAQPPAIPQRCLPCESAPGSTKCQSVVPFQKAPKLYKSPTWMPPETPRTSLGIAARLTKPALDGPFQRADRGPSLSSLINPTPPIWPPETPAALELKYCASVGWSETVLHPANAGPPARAKEPISATERNSLFIDENLANWAWTLDWGGLVHNSIDYYS